MTKIQAIGPRYVALLLLGVVLVAAAALPAPDPVALNATLSEWKVDLSQRAIAAGPATFTITNAGSIPHAFEVEGQGIERETALIQPGATATLTLILEPGTYDVYCPVGEDSHKKLGMETHVKVMGAKHWGSAGYGSSN